MVEVFLAELTFEEQQDGASHVKIRGKGVPQKVTTSAEVLRLEGGHRG